MIRKISFTDRTDWLELRKMAIGGSDASAVLGMNRWSSPLSVYCDKLGLIPPKEDNEAMRQGRDLEDYVAQRWCEETGKKVRRENHILVNDDLSFMHANIDRKVIGEKAGLECKTTSVYNDTDFENGDIPDTYYVQCQHYMAVTGWPVWYLAVLVLNRGFYHFRIERNEEDIWALIEIEKKFWDNHIIPQIPPEASDNDAEVLSTLYPDSYEGEVPLHDVSAVLASLDDAKAKKKELDEAIAEYENAIKLRMADAERGTDGKYIVTWKTSVSNRLDSNALKQEHPSIYNQFTKESSSRRFMIKQAK